MANAKLAIKMAIVKPIPAKNDTPIIWVLLMSDGTVISFILFANSTIDVIPILLPNTKQIIMLITSAVSNSTPLLKITPAFAKAKTGMIK